jgi:DNA-binding HxlR family transcriptional regulator
VRAELGRGQQLIQRTIWSVVYKAVVMKRLPRSVDCPVELSVELLRGKWKPVILARLKDQPLRYGDLRRLIPRLSDKVLTERLSDLQAQGLIVRESNGTGVGFYRLTEQGQTLRPILQSLYDWGEKQATELKVIVRSAHSAPENS